MAGPAGGTRTRTREPIHRCDLGRRRQVSPADWQERLRLATTDTEVIAIAKDYLDSLPAADAAMLPPRCQPRALLCAHDVSSYAFELVGQYAEATNASVNLVNRLAVFFTQASIRLSELVSSASAASAPVRASAAESP